MKRAFSNRIVTVVFELKEVVYFSNMRKSYSLKDYKNQKEVDIRSTPYGFYLTLTLSLSQYKFFFPILFRYWVPMYNLYA